MPETLEQERVKVADVADLRAHLTAKAAVEVMDADGSRWGFEVRAVEPSLLDPERAWYSQLLADNAEEFQKRLGEAVMNPPQGAIRAVLLRGVVRPALSAAPTPGGVWVDDLLRKDLLARHLYAEVMRVTLEGLFEVLTPESPAGESIAKSGSPS